MCSPASCGSPMSASGRTPGTRAAASGRSGTAVHPGTAVAVVGGGIAGLVAARELALGGARVTLLEREAVLGGRIRAATLAGTTFDVGAEAFATRGGAVAELIAELGIAERVVHPAPAGAWVVTDAGSLPLPPGGAVGIPARPMAASVRKHLGTGGALRAALEPLLPRERDVADSTTIAELVRRRAGARVLDRLVRPVTLGVYSAEPERLPLSAVPGLRAAYARTGSLVRAARDLRDANVAAGGAVASLAGGMIALVDALAADLDRLGVTVRTGVDVAVLAAARDNGAAAGVPAVAEWELRDGSDAVLARSAAVVLAVPEPVACALLSSAGPAAAAAAAAAARPPSQHDIEVIAIAIADARLDTAPRGTGALVAPGAGIAAKALTHVTAKWPDRAARVAQGTHVLRLSYGRAGLPPETAALDDRGALALACADASRILGLGLGNGHGSGLATRDGDGKGRGIDPDQVLDSVRQRWSVGAPPGPQPRLRAPSGIALVGDWVSGTGLASVIPGARAAAATLLGRRGPAAPATATSAAEPAAAAAPVTSAAPATAAAHPVPLATEATTAPHAAPLTNPESPVSPA